MGKYKSSIDYGKFDVNTANFFNNQEGLCYDERVFIEYQFKNGEIEVVAGISYYEEDVRFNVIYNDYKNISEMCDSIDIPYFCVRLLGEFSDNQLRKLCFSIDLEKCNNLGRDKLNSFLEIYPVEKVEHSFNLIMTEIDWIYFLYYLRGIEVENFYSFWFKIDDKIYYEYINERKDSLLKTMASRHLGYGKDICLSDIDMIFYKGEEKILLEFKSPCEDISSEKFQNNYAMKVKELRDNKLPSQDKLYIKLCNLLDCKGYKVYTANIVPNKNSSYRLFKIIYNYKTGRIGESQRYCESKTTHEFQKFIDNL